MQPTRSVTNSSSSVRPHEQGLQPSIRRGRLRSGVSSSGGQQNRIYALSGRQDLESSPDVVTGILYINPFVSRKYGKEPELLHQPFKVSTLVDESAIVTWIYHGCDVMIYGRHTLDDLNELEMVEFDVIIIMDWLASYYANVDYWMKVVHFMFPGEPIIE
ncbi:uncharacterized protein [Nicotiana tomentosiformis]|uniref:uncharacterized protein n=1 Tax=Nicotiana tomentosiformis TaxID=4098 RepID=UPI00388C8A18